MSGLNLTFVAEDPPRESWFAEWDPVNPGGLGADSTADVELAVRSSRGTRRATIAARRIPMAEAIDELAGLAHDAPASASAHAWAGVARAALSFIAAGKVLPWVTPAGCDGWRVDPLDRRDAEVIEALVAALPAEAHATPTAGRGRISDPTFAVRTACDAIADAFIRTPAAARIGTLGPFADRRPTKVPQLRPWVTDLAGVHCSSSRLVMTMHPPGATPAPDEWLVTFAIQSKSDPSLVVDLADYWQAPTEVMDRLGNQAEATLLAGLHTVTNLVEPLASVLDHVAPTTATIGDEQIEKLLDRLDELEAADIAVRWPSELVAPKIERQLVLSATAPAGDLPPVLGLESLLEVDWEFLLDGVPLTLEELTVLADAKRSVVPLRGRWVRLDPATLERLRAPTPPVGVTDALAAALSVAVEADPTSISEVAGLGLDDEHDPFAIRVAGALDELASRLRELSGERAAGVPSDLQAELRQYQKRGLAWLADLCELGLGGCLADDMGLGKTIQVLALHAHLQTEAPQRPSLVICPTSLLNNWSREATRFLPGHPTRIYHGPQRDLADVAAREIVITSYGVVRSDVEQLDELDWGLVVADEAQQAKNPRSRTARAIRELSSGRRIALTGTPVENNLNELWSILDWCVPGLLGPLQTFRRTLALPIERDGDRAATERLQRLVQPFLLRRTKTDPGIAPELPDKIERDVVVALTDEQITLYRATTEEALTEVAETEGINRHGLVLKLLTALKQITNHPAQFLRQDGPLDARSGKLEALDDLLATALAAGDATLVFTQYVRMGRMIVSHQRRRGVAIDLLHGGLGVKARQSLVDRFQNGDLDVLVLSLKAGGTGLNLTAATNVVHYDRWWNPAVEDQATDRAYRIGQTRAVTVHRIITEGTVEDRVADLLTAKRELAASITGGGESWIGDLDDEDLAELVTLAVR